MSDLAAFISARLDEDEADAKTAAAVAGPDWTWKTEVTLEDEVTDWITTPDGTFLADTMGGSDGDISAHIARHDPARVLREVEAKRSILAEHMPRPSQPGDGQWAMEVAPAMRCRVCAGSYQGQEWRRFAAPCWTLMQLAAAWSDHPDYDQEWAP